MLTLTPLGNNLERTVSLRNNSGRSPTLIAVHNMFLHVTQPHPNKHANYNNAKNELKLIDIYKVNVSLRGVKLGRRSRHSLHSPQRRVKHKKECPSSSWRHSGAASTPSMKIHCSRRICEWAAVFELCHRALHEAEMIWGGSFWQDSALLERLPNSNRSSLQTSH